MTLLEMSLTGSVFIAVVLLLRALLLNRLPKRTFPALWGVAILRLLLPFSVASALSVYALLPPEWEPFSAERSVSAPAAESEPILISGGEPAPIEEKTPSAPRPLPEKTETPYFSENRPSETAEPPAAPAPVSAETVLFFVWCGGAVLSASVLTAVYLRERRKFRASLPVEDGFAANWLAAHPIRRRVTVRRSDRIDAPLTYGLLRPVILLPDPPEQTDEKRLIYILTHELVHICRFDAVKKPICALALCVHWFNPLVWVMFFFYNRDLELACDEGVVRRLGEEQKSDYAKTLIGMEAERSGFLPLFSRFGGLAAEERIRAIMKIKKNSVIVSAAACLIVCATAGIFATSAAPKAEQSTAMESAAFGNHAGAESYALYKPYGLTVENGMLYYKGKKVRCFDDQVPTANFSIKAIGYYEKSGVIDVRAVREGENHTLVGLEVLSDEEFNARKPVDPTDFDLSLFDGYREFGLSYDAAKRGFFYEGKRIRLFWDSRDAARTPAMSEAPLSDSVSNWDDRGEIDLYAVRDFSHKDENGHGTLTGLRIASEAEYIENSIMFAASSAKWWTAEEYEQWIAAQEKELESLIGTGSGWYDGDGVFHEFTRESVDSSIAKYREILEKIRQGLLISRDNTLAGGSGDRASFAMIPPSGQAEEIEADEIAADFSEREEEAKARIEEIRAMISEITLISEYMAHGLRLRESDGALIYQGKLVRWFIDGVDLDGEGAIATRYTYYNEKGEIDLCTIREKKENGDGSYDPFGELVGIEECADLRMAEVVQIDADGFVVEDRAVAGIAYEESGAESSDTVRIVPGIEVTTAEGNGGGRTFSEIFAEYEPFGITYNEAEGNVYWNGRLVGTFADVSEKGAFSFQSRSIGNRAAVDVRTNYENGKFSSVSEMTEEQKNAEWSEDASDPEQFQYRFVGYDELSESSSNPDPFQYVFIVYDRRGRYIGS